MRSIVRRALVVGALVSAGAGAALLFTSGARARIVDVYVVVLAAVVMLALFRAIRLAAPPRPSGFEYALTRLRAPRDAQSAELPEERDVVLSRVSVLDLRLSQASQRSRSSISRSRSLRLSASEH